jgi:hypothetical protein
MKTEARTCDYHSEVGNISYDAKYVLVYQMIGSVRRPVAGLHLSPM